MKKKTTVLLALISMCLIATAGIGTISASDDAVASVTLYKINLDDPEAPPIPIKTFEGNTSVSVMMSLNDDGTVNIEEEGEVITTEDLKPSEKIDASARTLYYKASATNYPMGWSCGAEAHRSGGAVRAEAWSGYLNCEAWVP